MVAESGSELGRAESGGPRVMTVPQVRKIFPVVTIGGLAYVRPVGIAHAFRGLKQEGGV